ncbi:B3 domain-containing transcription repressor VAL2 [Linum perenne]
MASKTCMNALCGASTSSGWRKGWGLRSGESAHLCDKCGSAYEQSIFCEVFHSKDSGWRECSSCGKRLHCGCIASRLLLELLDGGGINCITCSRNSGANPVGANRKSNGFTRSRIDDSSEMQSISVDNGMDGDGSLLQLGNSTDSIGARQLLQLHGDDAKSSFSQMKQEARLSHIGEIGGTSFSHFNQASNTFSQATKPEINRAIMGAKDLYDSLAQTNLTIALGSSLGSPTPFGPPVDERAQSKTPPLQGSRSRHLLPKPPKSNLVTGLEPNNVMVSPIRVARPPAEGRGRNQLLPRYWPRITDQELQQISMDSNSTIVPLFEKVLSASDAGRIGRLVLPKACAEAYFPPISQPEGIPLRIQDVKGKEWVFQFRFWPNNNSRMYVLEGVTPCIQSMQLQAGDTVTFSRMDPEGKLVMGFRKASNSFAMQDIRPSPIPNGVHSSESSFSENLPVTSGYCGLLQSLKGSNDAHLSALSKHLQSVSDISWNQSEKLEDRTQEGLMLPSSILIPERKKAKNIGSKNKRLLMDGQDALELKLTWEEAQDLLRPAPTAKPSIVTIEDHDFEEYEEPPVFGKRSIFVARSTGILTRIQEQWAQCDGCSKWRRLPIDVLLPPKWTCSENAWDQTRCSCSAPDELTPRELENLLRQNKDFKKRRVATSTQEPEPSGLDALANAAILGDMGEPGTSAAAVATTTKHPRHRPGCSCIVCIQPPSGKGKHKPTCTCNVCMTVKRRFKTLMMRKKKRQSEREAEIAQRNQQLWGEAKAESSSKADASTTQYGLDHFENELEATIGQSSNKLVEMKSADNNGKGHIDLNCHPDREEDAQMTVMNLLQVASLPLEAYLKQNRSVGVLAAEQNRSVGVLASEQNRSVGSLVSEQNRSEPPHLPAVTAQEGGGNGDSEGQKQLPEHGKLEEDSAVRDCEENNQLETDKTQKGTE